MVFGDDKLGDNKRNKEKRKIENKICSNLWYDKNIAL